MISKPTAPRCTDINVVGPTFSTPLVISGAPCPVTVQLYGAPASVVGTPVDYWAPVTIKAKARGGMESVDVALKGSVGSASRPSRVG